MPVHIHLIPDEVISRIEAIITNEDETRLTDYLRGDAAQSFVDSIQEVRFHIPSLLKRGLIIFTLFGSFTFDPSPSTDHRSGSGSPQPPATAPEEIFGLFVSYMRSPGSASEISPNPTLLQPFGSPAVQRWVRGRVDGILPRSARRSQGSEGMLDE